jgi:hypothetical protein
MATQLKTLIFRNLSNVAHYKFCSSVKKQIDESPEVITGKLGGLIDEFDALVAEEKAISDWVYKSTLTAKIEEVDQVMGAALTALRATVRGMKTFSVTSLADTATRVYTMLMKYGHVNAKPYEEQSRDVETILGQIGAGGAYCDDVNVLKKTSSIVGGHIVDLQKALNNFGKLLAERDAHSLLKPERTFSEVRRKIDPVYHKIALIINAGAVLGDSPAFVAFINALNPEIERLNIEHHRARKDLGVGDHTIIDPIETQYCQEGCPTTPVPTVHYREGYKPSVQLYLGRDFTVTYRNNCGTGMAEVTVTGKGKYRGSKTTTFIIARQIQL